MHGCASLLCLTIFSRSRRSVRQYEPVSNGPQPARDLAADYLHRDHLEDPIQVFALQLFDKYNIAHQHEAVPLNISGEWTKHHPTCFLGQFCRCSSPSWGPPMDTSMRPIQPRRSFCPMIAFRSESTRPSELLTTCIWMGKICSAKSHIRPTPVSAHIWIAIAHLRAPTPQVDPMRLTNSSAGKTVKGCHTEVQ